MLGLLRSWQGLIWLFGLALAFGLIGHYFVFKILLKISRRTSSLVDNSFVKHCYRPLLWMVVLVVVRLVLPYSLGGDALDAAKHIFSLAIIALVCWLIIKCTYVLDDYILHGFQVESKDNLRARKIHTQLGVLKRIVIVAVIILALGTMLMTFEKVRQLGTTILASAGIIGLIVGMAAQKTIGTFIAGIQIAFTQPIRIDDVVIVENEWGRIEEITLTYVVVKIWDLRRLIVPITYFIEKPFQNWTRKTADLLGTVFIYVDYKVPIEAIRQHLQTILKESELWDGKVCVLQVTNTSEKTVELRALMSAPDASSGWTLRCHVREKLVEFIRQNYPQSLPKLRVDLPQPVKR